jgi:citrate lyase subunit beta/citryl-CoA lyase
MVVGLPGPGLLFCPADRPDRYSNAVAAADVVVLDLEDAVAPANRAAARQAIVSNRLDPARAIVRVNATDTADHALDLAAARAGGYGTVMLPKAETRAQIDVLAPFNVVALCETPKGVLAAEPIASAELTVALMWGAEDLLAGLGGRSSREADGSFRPVAMSAGALVLFAAKAHGKQAIDAVFTNYGDEVGLQAEARSAADTGFDLKACIHPKQVDVVRAAFRPSDDELDWARRVLEAGSDGGVTSIDGRMIDGPLIAQARRTLQFVCATDLPRA